MSETIPLGATLGVKLVEVVVADVWHQSLDMMHELLALESWRLRNIQRKAVQIAYPLISIVVDLDP